MSKDVCKQAVYCTCEIKNDRNSGETVLVPHIETAATPFRALFDVIALISDMHRGMNTLLFPNFGRYLAPSLQQR